MLEPPCRLAERAGIQMQPVFATPDRALHKPSALEDLHVLGDAVERNRKTITVERLAARPEQIARAVGVVVIAAAEIVLARTLL